MVMITTTKKTDQIPDCRPCLGVHQLLPQSNLICKDVAQLPMWILPGGRHYNHHHPHYNYQPYPHPDHHHHHQH